MLGISIVEWGMSTKDFWRMVPTEWWAVFDGQVEKSSAAEDAAYRLKGMTFQQVREIEAENEALGI